MSSNQKTVIFAAGLCLICSFLLTFAATSLKPFQDKNIRIDKQKNVLKVLRLIKPKQVYSNDELASIFERHVQAKWVKTDGKLVGQEEKGTRPVYLSIDDNGQVISYAIPVSGYGLWSYLYGYFALKSDGATVVGITFYQHGETPGLGAECEKPWFQNNFVGKRIVNSRGEFVSIGVVKGKVNDVIAKEKRDNFVDGISGATVTSKGIQTFLKRDLANYEALSKRLREGRSFL